MIRNIVKIDEEKCNGCGQCIDACAEGAIRLIDGKAKLVSDTYCDGLGACLGECPQDAITIEEREAQPFDEQAVEEHLAQIKTVTPDLPCGCPGTMATSIDRTEEHTSVLETVPIQSQLGNWPVQLKLVAPNAPYFQNADLLLVADCVPFAYGDFHTRFLREKPVIIGCPKLDDPAFYAEKLTELLKQSPVKSLTVVHMEVPCCSGLTRIAEIALENSGGAVPAYDVTISIRGEILAEHDLRVAQVS